MKNIILLLLIIRVTSGFAQTFTSSPSIAIPSSTTITDDIVVTGVGIINCDYGLTEVCIDLIHTWDADLDIFLIDPNGDRYMLTTDNGGSGNNYSVTCFDMTAGTNVTVGSAPFNGSYVPEGDLALVNNGQNADGTWTLEITDDAGGDDGTLFSWTLTYGATPPCPPPPLIEDCEGGITVCSDATFTGNSSGGGDIVDLDRGNSGCLDVEHESSWYYFQAKTNGTYAFIIETVVDYDFAIWGPMASVTCSPVGAPLRCSYSGVLGDTGLQAGAGDNTEGSGGDAFVDPIVAVADDVFIVIIDNFTADGTSFDWTWTLTEGATLDCTPLVVDLISFNAIKMDQTNLLHWKTKTEIDCSHYILEKSLDGESWSFLTTITGAGNSNQELSYQFMDGFVRETVNYYRLTQVDFDGEKSDLGVVSVNNNSDIVIVKIINLMGKEVTDDYNGLKIYIYSDGSMEKVISE